MARSVYDSSAYITLVMLGDCYVTPALVLGRSIESSGSFVKRRYCMVTNDVSLEARKLLRRYWTLVDVDYRSRDNLPSLLSNRMNEIYGSWIKHSFTKLAFLNVAHNFGVRHCLYFDADTVVLRNIDHIFVDFDRVVSVSSTKSSVVSDTPKVNFATSFYPFFSSLGLCRYHEGTLLREVLSLERDRRSDEWFSPVSAKHLTETWNAGIACGKRKWRMRRLVGKFTETGKERKKDDTDKEADKKLNEEMIEETIVPEEEKVQEEKNIIERARMRESDRYFLCNTSMMLVTDVTGQGFNDLSRSLDKRLNDRANLLFQPNVSYFANGWEEQLLVQSVIGVGCNLYHLRSFCNVNAGFWDQSNVKHQPYTITWWGTNKPWTDLKSVPKYTDVYLFRYFYQLVERDMLDDPVLRESFQRNIIEGGSSVKLDDGIATIKKTKKHEDVKNHRIATRSTISMTRNGISGETRNESSKNNIAIKRNVKVRNGVREKIDRISSNDVIKVKSYRSTTAGVAGSTSRPTCDHRRPSLRLLSFTSNEPSTQFSSTTDPSIDVDPVEESASSTTIESTIGFPSTESATTLSSLSSIERSEEDTSFVPLVRSKTWIVSSSFSSSATV